MQKRSELIFNLLLLPIDFLAVTAAFILSYLIRVRLEDRLVPNPLGFTLFLKIFLIIIPIWIFIFAMLGLYSQSSHRGRIEEMSKVFIGVSGGVMAMILIDFVSRTPLFPAKAIPIYGYGLSLVFVMFGRQVVRGFQRWLFHYGVGVQRVLVIGSGPIAQRLVRDLQGKGSGYKVLGIIDNARNVEKRLPGFQVYQSLEEAKKSKVIKNLDGFIQADSTLEQADILEMVSYASDRQLSFRFVPNQLGLYALNSKITVMSGIPVMEIRRTPLDGWGRIIKRVFDVLGSAAGLIILSPLFLVIAVIIKITDPGPVFYKHKRISRAGKKLMVYKFRTMKQQFSSGAGFSGKTDAEIFIEMGRPDLAKEFAKEQKLTDDPRVSRIGKFLRKTSLDELPQLINAFIGNMSLVGPRPIVEAELERYGKEAPTFLILKPGITGLWQTSGRSDLSYEERVKLDIYYIENWSLWLDIRILFRTVMVILKGKGAY
jgi:exopolysaccharide biosynthesis polyprenyl glycosylphosphotransferase